MSYLLVGNYGAGNLGDEALKEYFLTFFPEVRWNVLSARPKRGEYPRFPAGFRSFSKPWWKTLRALQKSHGVVFGGGSLFTDTESPRACVLWWWHAIVARFFGKPVFLAFQGIGPFRTRLGEWCAQWVVKRAMFISVRDADSYARIASWQKNTKVVQTADPVISLVKKENDVYQPQNVLIVIPRRNSGEALFQSFREATSGKQWDGVRILSLQPDNAAEQKICSRLREVCEAPSQVIPIASLRDLEREVSSGSFVLTQRYHGALVALTLGKEMEVVGQGVGDKLEGVKRLMEKGAASGDLREKVNIGEAGLRKALHCRFQ